MIDRILTAGALGLIAVYRYGIRPLIGPSCRYFPSCSEYGAQAFSRHGFLAGGWLTLKRLGRCHPWCAGGLDPVPDAPVLRWRHLGTCVDPACARQAASRTAFSSADAPAHQDSPTSRPSLP